MQAKQRPTDASERQQGLHRSGPSIATEDAERGRERAANAVLSRASLLALQRSAGNGAVSWLVTVQRDYETFESRDRNYRNWLTEAKGGQFSAWEDAAEELNGMSPDDIRKRLDDLSKNEIAQLQQGAIRNHRVGSGANVVALGAEAIRARAAGGEKVSAPSPGTVGIKAILEGTEQIKDVREAKEYWDLFKETVEGEEQGPLAFIKLIVDMVRNVLHDLGTEEQGCRLRAWCYTVMYESLGMGRPPRPKFQGRSLMASSDELNGRYWDKGANEADEDLKGTDGVRLINRVLLLVAAESEPGKALNEIWKKSCEEAKYDQLAKAYEQLPWPGPLGI